MSQNRYSSQALPTYIPAADDIYLPPPPPAEQQAETKSAPRSTDGGLGFIIVVADILVTGIIVGAMLIDGQQAGRAILVGSAFFMVTTGWFALVLTGSLSSIIAALARERTERRRIDAYQDLGEMALHWRQEIEHNRALELQARTQPVEALPPPNAGPLRTPYRENTFVTPYDNRSKAAHADPNTTQPDTTAEEALAWVSGLYLDGGQPDPKQVQTTGEKAGWLKVRMLGSKRGTGSKEAGLWLLHRKIIVRAPGGYRLNLRSFPRRTSLRVFY